MREYIKKFNTPASADGYAIEDIPFISTIASTGLNLYCIEEDKQLENNDGTVEVVERLARTITIHYEWGSLNGRWEHEIVPERDIAEPLQQDKVVNAPYTLTEDDFVIYHTNCDGYSSDDGASGGQDAYNICDENDVIVTASFDWNDHHLYFGEDVDCREYTINKDITIYINIYEMCIAQDTPITLSDGTTKMIQDITYDNELLVWDFDNAQYSSAKPLWIKEAQKTQTYWLCKLENGTEIKLVGSNGKSHRLFNYTDQVFEYPQDCIGKEVYTEQGITKLISCEYVNEETEYYNIITNQHINLFANDILTSCRYNNIYPIKDMKFVKDDRSIIPYEEYKNSIPYDYYIGMRLGELPIGIDNNIRYVKKLLLTLSNVH